METWWPLRFPQRLMMFINIILLPFRLVTLFAELIMAIGIIAAAYTIWGLYTGSITNSQVETIIKALGSQITLIMHQQGIY
jgi:hypothetical protein